MEEIEQQHPGIYAESDLSSLSREQLNALYKEKVGIDPTHRIFSIERLIQGIQNPTTELDQLHEEDREDDKKDIEATYRR